MIVVCNANARLADGVKFNLSPSDAIYRYVKLDPGCSSVVLYHCPSVRSPASDYQFLLMLNERQLDKYREKYRL